MLKELFSTHRDPAKTPHTPPWFKYGMVFLLLYAVASYFTTGGHSPQDGTTSEVGAQTSVMARDPEVAQAVEVLQQHAASTTETITRFFTENDLFPTLRQRELSPGQGRSAQCGEEVELSYYSTLLEGGAIEGAAEAPRRVTVILGRRNVPLALDLGTIGMQEGGVRELQVASAYAYDTPGFARDNAPTGKDVQFHVTLARVVRGAEAQTGVGASLGLKRFNDGGVGEGPLAVCGDKVALHVAVFAPDGKKLFSTRDTLGAPPIELVLGGGQAFLGLERGVEGMRRGEKRVLLVPPVWQTPLLPAAKGALPEISFPPKQTAIVEVERVG